MTGVAVLISLSGRPNSDSTRLFVFDRYGPNERELDLCELYANGVVEMYGAAP